MKSSSKAVGLAMYTIHKSAETDMYNAFMRIAELGYTGIEFYGEQTFDKQLLKKAIADSGLSLTGWHVEWANLQDDTYDRTAEYLAESGCPVAVIPCLGGKWNIGHTREQECRDVWLRYFDKIEEINEKLKRDGMRTAYHNHEHEFMISYDGKKLFDFIFDSLPEDIIIEFDSGNCIEGGDDPLRVLRKYHDREMILHLKPYSKELGFDTYLGAADDENDWRTILDPSVKDYLWKLIESENSVLDEFDNCRLCMEGYNRILDEMG